MNEAAEAGHLTISGPKPLVHGCYQVFVRIFEVPETTPLTNHCRVSCTVGRTGESSLVRCGDRGSTLASVPLPSCCVFADGMTVLISMAVLSDAVSVGGGRVLPSRRLQSRRVDWNVAPTNFLSVSDVLGSDSRFNERIWGAKLTSNVRSLL